ncbi:MAG: isochorismatase family protein [Nitrososphaerales archaeon]
MTTALLLIDVQRNMLDPPNPVPSNVEIRRALESLLARARKAGAFVVHVQNDGSPGDPDSPHATDWDLVFHVAAGELVVRKNKSDAFTNATLGAALVSRQVDRVIVAGMQSNYWISATCRGALHHGLEVILASGAHATYDEKESASAISVRVEEELNRDGIRVVSTNEIGFQSPQFFVLIHRYF